MFIIQPTIAVDEKLIVSGFVKLRLYGCGVDGGVGRRPYAGCVFIPKMVFYLLNNFIKIYKTYLNTVRKMLLNIIMVWEAQKVIAKNGKGCQNI